MKRGWLSLALCLAMMSTLFVIPAQAAGPMEEVLGVYEGYYYAQQGQTGVTLTVYQEGGAVKALFDFYNLSGYVLSGKVNARGSQFNFYAEKPNDAYEQIQESVFNDHRYERVDQGMTWSQAWDYAKEKGGYLAVITSAEEQAFIETPGGQRLCLGHRRSPLLHQLGFHRAQQRPGRGGFHADPSPAQPRGLREPGDAVERRPQRQHHPR